VSSTATVSPSGIGAGRPLLPTGERVPAGRMRGHAKPPTGEKVPAGRMRGLWENGTRSASAGFELFLPILCAETLVTSGAGREPGPQAPAQVEKAPEKARPPARAKPAVVPFEMLPTNHMLVRARINGKGPYHLVFDLGAPVTLLSNRASESAGVVD